MDLEKALLIVNDKCDIDLERLKGVFREAIQRKYGEQSARGLLESNSTVAVVKDELDLIINEKAKDYIKHYSQVIPNVESDDYNKLEQNLKHHFKTKLEFIYSEACHQLDTVNKQVRYDIPGTTELHRDYEDSLRRWLADIQILIAKLQTRHMNKQPTVVYNLHGANSRVNNNSLDSSNNIVCLSESQLFSDVKKALAKITDEEAKANLTKEVEELECLKDKPKRASAYLKFIEHAANHITVLTPFLSALAQWANQ